MGNLVSIFLIVLGLFCPASCLQIYAQDLATVKPWPAAEYIAGRDTAYILELLSQAKSIGGKNKDSAEGLNKEVLALSRQFYYPRGVAIAYTQLAMLNKYNLPEAIHYQKQAIALSSNMGDTVALLDQYAILTDFYEKNGEYKTIITLYSELLPWFKGNGTVIFKNLRARLQNNVGRSYFQLGNYDSSLFYYNSALILLRPFTKVNCNEAVLAYAALGMIHARLERMDKALSYFQSAYRTAVAFEDTSAILIQLGNLGALHYDMKDYQTAKRYLYKSLEMENQIKRSRAQLYAMLATVLLTDGIDSVAAALQYAMKSYALAKQHNSYNDLVQALNILGHVHKKMGNYKRAEKYFLESIALTEEKGKLDLLFYFYQDMDSLYVTMRQFDKAHVYQRKYYELKDSVLGAGTSERIAHIEHQYQVARKDKTLALQQAALQVQESKIREKNFWIISIVLTAILLAIISFMLVRSSKVKQKVSLERMLHEKEIEILSVRMQTEQQERLRIGRELHDGIVSQMLGIKLSLNAIRKSDGEQINDLALARATEQLEETIMDLRGTAHSLMPDVLVQQGLVNATSLLCRKVAKAGAIDIAFQVYGAIPTLQDYATLSLYRIVQELIQNTLKHAQARHLIVQFNYNQPYLCITVEDDGIGIPLPMLNNHSGQGMGLQTIRQRVEELRGTLELKSVPNQSTTVYMEFEDKWLT